MTFHKENRKHYGYDKKIGAYKTLDSYASPMISISLPTTDEIKIIGEAGEDIRIKNPMVCLPNKKQW